MDIERSSCLNLHISSADVSSVVVSLPEGCSIEPKVFASVSSPMAPFTSEASASSARLLLSAVASPRTTSKSKLRMAAWYNGNQPLEVRTQSLARVSTSTMSPCPTSASISAVRLGDDRNRTPLGQTQRIRLPAMMALPATNCSASMSMNSPTVSSSTSVISSFSMTMSTSAIGKPSDGSRTSQSSSVVTLSCPRRLSASRTAAHFISSSLLKSYFATMRARTACFASPSAANVAPNPWREDTAERNSGKSASVALEYGCIDKAAEEVHGGTDKAADEVHPMEQLGICVDVELETLPRVVDKRICPYGVGFLATSSCIATMNESSINQSSPSRRCHAPRPKYWGYMPSCASRVAKRPVLQTNLSASSSSSPTNH
mmetsp:Transcript_38825/g.106945  ORF Transcript_38825/g.106945 Transcript_38825/m.106945 type:complete len:374 (-) Transcript_38825:574-1695(-)